MKVIHVISGLNTGGAERQLSSLLMHASQSGAVEHVIISLGGGGYIAHAIAELGVRVHMLNVGKPHRGLMALPRLLRLAQSERPGLIQGWMYHGNLAASLVGCVLRRCRTLWNIRHSLHDLRKEKRTTQLAVRAGATLSRSPVKIIYNSHTSAEQHSAFGYKKRHAIVIPNGFDCEIFRPNRSARADVRAELGLADEHVLVGLIARYHPIKDHINFLRAAALVHAQYSQARFLLAGNGVTFDNPVLAGLVQELGLSNSTHLLGERRDVVRLYAASDIVVNSSWGEAFPNVLGEAMACGVPCVATGVGDTRAIIGETGYVVPPRDPETLANAILGLCRVGRDARTTFGISARKRIQQCYGLESMARRYQELYSSLGKPVCAASQASSR